jgi:predicted transcriptional regulator
VFVFSDKTLDSKLNTDRDPSDILERSLKKTCSKMLTDLQKSILVHISETECTGKTSTRYAQEISKKMKVPESTVKWSMASLRDALLIEAGRSDMKGVPVKVTYPGLLVAEELKGEIAR